jgi:succinate dehydrogenase/fumarate reductase flavoprotein subunit
MMITYRLIERLEDLAAKNDGRVRILTKARATKLLTNPTGAVIGVEYEKDGAMHAEYGPVVIATGGFAADFAPDSLLSQVEAQWRESAPWKGIPLPPLLSLPTTNGPHCSGDGIKMALAYVSLPCHVPVMSP